MLIVYFDHRIFAKNLTYVIFWSKGVNHVYGIHFRRNDKEMIGSILKIGQSLKDSTKRTKI